MTKVESSCWPFVAGYANKLYAEWGNGSEGEREGKQKKHGNKSHLMRRPRMKILSGYHADTPGILYSGCMKPVTEACREIMCGHWNNYVAIILLRFVARNTRFFHSSPCIYAHWWTRTNHQREWRAKQNIFTRSFEKGWNDAKKFHVYFLRKVSISAWRFWLPFKFSVPV